MKLFQSLELWKSYYLSSIYLFIQATIDARNLGKSKSSFFENPVRTTTNSSDGTI